VGLIYTGHSRFEEILSMIRSLPLEGGGQEGDGVRKINTIPTPAYLSSLKMDRLTLPLKGRERLVGAMSR